MPVDTGQKQDGGWLQLQSTAVCCLQVNTGIICNNYTPDQLLTLLSHNHQIQAKAPVFALLVHKEQTQVDKYQVKLLNLHQQSRSHLSNHSDLH